MPLTEYQHRISEEESSRIQRFLYIAAAGTAAFGLLLAIAISSAGGGNLPNPALAEEQMVLNAYSREMEQAADQQALVLLQAQFGHVGGATQLFEFLSTHPAIDQRIRTIKALAEENGWRSEPATPYPDYVRAALNSKP